MDSEKDIERRVGEYVDFVYAAASRQMGGRSGVEDVVQGVFLVMAKKGREGKLPAEKFMLGWLVEVTRYAVKGARRGEVRRGFHEGRAGSLREEAMREGMVLEEDAEGVRGALDEALLSLGRVDREVVVRRYLRGEAVKVVAEAMGMEENTAGRRIGRALEKLRRVLGRRGVAAPVGVLTGVMMSEALVKAPMAWAGGVMGSAGSVGAKGVARIVLRRMVMVKSFSFAGLTASAAAVVLMMLALGWHGGRLAANAPVVGGAGGDATIAASATAPAINEEERLEAAWGDLAGLEPGASRAMLVFAARPERTVGFFKERLKPLVIGESEVRELIGALGSTDEKVWRPAFEKLEYFDPRLAIGLTTLMEEVKEEPARNRLVAILSDRDLGVEEMTITLSHIGAGDSYNFFGKYTEKAGGLSWWAENVVGRLTDERRITKKSWTRADRAILLLAHIGTPEALAIVRDMATGHPDAQPTKVAKSSLERLAAASEAGGDKKVDMERWWADLGKSGPEGTEALLNFASRPEEATEFFKSRLLPLTIDAEGVQALIEALGSEDASVRRPAFEKLSYFDPRLAIELPELMRDVDEPIARRRLIEVIMDVPEGALAGKTFKLVHLGKDNYDFEDENGASYGAITSVLQIDLYNAAPHQTWRRATRAEVVLGAIGTPEAVGILKGMATGHADAEPTRVANEELGRMGT